MHLIVHTHLLAIHAHRLQIETDLVFEGRSSLHTAEAENALRQDNDHAGPVIKIAHHADESSSKKRCRPTKRESMAKRDEETTEDITRS